MRSAMLVLAGVVAAAGTALGQDGELTPARARALIPDAAGMPATFLDQLGSDANPDPARLRPPNGDSLTWMVLTYRPVDQAAKDPMSFRFLEEFPNPAKVAAALAGPRGLTGKSRPVATVIQPEYITDCSCKADGEVAAGVVSFRAAGVYEGRAEYTARRRDGRWRIEEFRLPDLKLTTALAADGKWVKK